MSGFLTQRLVEVTSDNIKLDMVSAGGGSQTEDPNTLKKYLSCVETIMSRLTELKMQQLQTIRDSPSYAERLTDSFKQKLKLQDQVRRSIEEMKEKISDAEDEKTKGLDQIKTMHTMVKQLKTEVEIDISKRYNGRKVIITGA